MNAYTDGACRVANPGQASCAFVVFDERTLHDCGSRYLGPELHTNNYAEYQGLLDLLKWAELNQVRYLNIFCDSKLVVNQVNNKWKVAVKELVPLCFEAMGLMYRGKHTLCHVRGHSGCQGNELADQLCNAALDLALGVEQ